LMNKSTEQIRHPLPSLSTLAGERERAKEKTATV